MEPSRCTVTQPVGWTVQGSSGEDFRDDGSVLAADNVSYLRNVDCSDSHAELKLVFKQPISAHTLDITCNARFVEIYVQNEALLKYQSTTRGKNTDAPNIFAAQVMEPIECRELHLRFVSIKPVAADDGELVEDPAQLKIVKLSLQYRTTGAAPFQPPTDTNANTSAMNMMSMMALSMMAPGGMAGMSGGMGPSPPLGAGAGGGGGMAALMGMAVSAMQSGNSGGGVGLGPGAGAGGRFGMDSIGRGTERRDMIGSGQQQSSAPTTGPAVSHDVAVDGKVAGRHRPVAVGGEVAGGGTDKSDNQPSLQPVPTSQPAPVSASNRPAPTPTPSDSAARPPSNGLDVSQLASILWAVKGSIVSDIDALLDRKLSPVLAKLESLESQVRQLQKQLDAGEDAAQESGEVGDGIPNQEHVVD